MFVFEFYVVDRASRYNRVKNNHLDAQRILSTFRQPLHVSGVSRPIIRMSSGPRQNKTPRTKTVQKQIWCAGMDSIRLTQNTDQLLGLGVR
jgi:hypothetical protein